MEFFFINLLYRFLILQIRYYGLCLNIQHCLNQKRLPRLSDTFHCQKDVFSLNQEICRILDLPLKVMETNQVLRLN